MWKRLAKSMCCPICNIPVELCVFKENSVTVADNYIDLAKKRNLFDHEFNQYVDAGLMLCHGCRLWFPIAYGLPVFIPYRTPLHEQFSVDFKETISQLPVKYHFPTLKPLSGEHFVMDSFSKEWLDYEYDGVIWGMDYEDHKKRFLGEIDSKSIKNDVSLFLEIGCGLGITTHFANQTFETDVVGVDLSLAVIKATEHYKTNPFVHFVQASAFYLPFKKETADLIYSHGVLHHTYSTYEAFKAIAPYCRPGGLLYVWVYGNDSKRGSLPRRIAYFAEMIARPVLSKRSSSPVTSMFLGLIACGYMVANTFQHLRNSHIQKYNYQRALHAARDRFTPLYAHRQDYEDVSKWFQEAGFEYVQKVDWRTMPVADQDNYRRNTGVRGIRKNKEQILKV
jgi:SAM-dependent methyltransferase/uncharacterized protein YbaR (Trm112 family)